MPDMAANRRAFYQLLANTIVASVTNMTVWFALIFFVYLETSSVMATSFVSGIYLVALTLSGFWFGSLVDRYKKRNALIGSGLISLFFYSVGFVLYISAPEGAFTDAGSVILWIFVPLLILGEIADNVRGIALRTIITSLFPEEGRDKANGLAGTATGISFLVTSAISGLLVAHSGMYLVLILSLVLLAAVTVHLFTMSIPEDGAARAEGDAARVDICGTLAIISAVPGLLALILFSTLNNLLGGVFMGLMDAYGLSLVSVEVWGLLWAILSFGFILGGLLIARWGLGKNPLLTLFLGNISIWSISSVFAIRSSIALLTTGMFIYMTIVPFIEAAEYTIIQKVVPPERQGRAFGLAQSVEMAASPVMTFLIGPIAELVFIPFMTTGAGVNLIGGWFGTGADRGIALVFTVTGMIGLVVTLIAMRSKYYRLLRDRYVLDQAHQ
jgi:MFS transporter, DHA3 family, multidrug efflux protein